MDNNDGARVKYILIYLGTSNASGKIVLFGVVAGNSCETGRHAIGTTTSPSNGKLE